jgi:hypothetical protein
MIEDALKADLSGSRAKDLSKLLTESADLSIYKQIKDNPLKAKAFKEEGKSISLCSRLAC